SPSVTTARLAVRPPRHLRVHNVHDDPTQVWTMDVELTEAEPGTALTFSQPLNSREMVREVGPGWEFYLDRLQQSLETGEQATIEWDGYMDLAPEYAQEFGLA
ncbi:SRPBCC domain-containing protein, partial [Kytococcus sp. HMSC28H12]|uniref:SRPBCC domain-containing protein n=2 Tax=Kytococcus TaxID=57499 RepID=UPI000B02CBEF